MAVAVSVPHAGWSGAQAPVACLDDLARFRGAFYDCLTARSDVLFELCDAVLCVDGPVVSLPELSLVGVHRRGHGGLYAALAKGRVNIARFQAVLAGLPLPRDSDRRVRVALDVTPWERPDAECSPERSHCHRRCRCGGDRPTIPGWDYSVAVALESGASSWTLPLDIVRIAPDEDATDVTATQIRELIGRLDAAGQLREGDPPVLIVLDAGYDLPRLSWLTRDLPVQLLGRLRANRVLRARPDQPAHTGRPARHGPEFRFADPATHPEPEQTTTGVHDRYGQVQVQAWGRLHPRLVRQHSWADHHAELPIVEATILSVHPQRLPGTRNPKPLWLWYSHPDATTAPLDRLWWTYLRRFDAEHTFRFAKQVLGLTRPRLRTPEQADRWAWLILAAYTQLHLARRLTADLRAPWQRPQPPDQLTPSRVRRGFRHLQHRIGTPAKPPKPTRPGTGRPPGRTSIPAPRYPVGKKLRKKDKPRRGSNQPTS